VNERKKKEEDEEREGRGTKGWRESNWDAFFTSFEVVGSVLKHFGLSTVSIFSEKNNRNCGVCASSSPVPSYHLGGV
jgi:hypothetical protein